MLEPLNTEWNRKTGILPGKGQIMFLGVKHGISYFTWTSLDGAVLFLQCDEAVFKKHFNFHGHESAQLVKDNEEKLAELLQKKAKFLKYPFDVVV